LFAVAALSFQIAKVGGQAVIAVTCSFKVFADVALFGLLTIELMLKVLLLSLETGLLVTCLQEVTVSGVMSLLGLLKIHVLVLRNFIEFAFTLLKSSEIVLGSLETFVGLAVLALLLAINITKTVHLLLIAASLFLKLLELVGGTVDIFSENVGLVHLGLAVTLVSKDFGLSAGDLLTKSSDLNLHVVVATVLIIEVVSGIVAFFLKTMQVDAV